MNLIHKCSAAFSRESCEKAINWFEQNIDRACAGGAGAMFLNNLELTIRPDASGEFFDLVAAATRKGADEFKEKYKLLDTNLGAWTLDFTSIQLSKWEPNNYYEYIHCETGPDNFLSRNRRVFSWIIYLNDIKQGGGTEFIYQEITTIPKAGDFYIWPSGASHIHRGVNAPLEKKYTITGHFIYVNFTCVEVAANIRRQLARQNK